MMEPAGRWLPLPVFPGLPALLVSLRFGKSSYTLHITDLANVWVERLDRRGILLRSLQENTSIDLVDADPEQWAVFLSKLEAALDPMSPNHHLTGLGIAAGNHAGSPDGLTLHITCELPKPLAALEWPIHLAKCPPASLASELVLPLIRGRYLQSREADDLMNQLKEKDALITKLVDKLSTMHTPLELIFNSLSAKHATSRAAAEERIKGLAPFDEGTWRSQQNIEPPQDAPALLRSVFGDSEFSCVTIDTGLGASDVLIDWWAKLGPRSHAALKPENDLSHSEPQEMVCDSNASSIGKDNEDFQVQVTPTRPLLRSPGSGKSTRRKATESSESGVSDGQPTRPQNKSRPKIGALGHTNLPTRNEPSSQSTRTLQADDDTESESEDEGKPATSGRTGQPNTRLVTIGEPRQSPKPTRDASAIKSLGEASDETASGSDSDSDGPPKRQPSPRSAPLTPRKGALGRIGGKSKDPSGSTQAPSELTFGATSDDPASPKRAEVRKIGAIGRRPDTESKKTLSNTRTEPEHLETDEQKAERKRAELANELSRQTTVPARKKRKF
ncbi:putative C6 zinc finger domain-containing protein [Rosellinia necatrix]|uniref:Non-homologous end-joining factor 1 n=1 Tax=Rosellinia necatrix TaxID=77044 RepID=A0A1W2TIX8_ROSNE|nr:putative C6 zinc finger domain-containing protein [Rosellinia necatrix]